MRSFQPRRILVALILTLCCLPSLNGQNSCAVSADINSLQTQLVSLQSLAQSLIESKLPSGTPLWSKRFGNVFNDGAVSVALDPAGDIVIVGHYSYAVDFGGGFLPSAGDTDAFVAKYSPAGAFIWAKRYGSTGTDRATSVAIDADGNIFVGGGFTGTVDLGGGPLVSAGASDQFIMKLTSDGSHLWSKRIAPGFNQSAPWIATDSSGNVVLATTFSGSADLNGQGLTSAGESDILVAQYSSNGVFLWAKSFGDSSYQFADTLSLDRTGNIILAGSFSGTINFGGVNMTAIGEFDGYLAKLTNSGEHLWSRRTSGGNAMGTAGADGTVIMAGQFSLPTDFGNGTVTPVSSDLFLVKYASDGTYQWSKTFGSASTLRVFPYGVAVDDVGNIAFSGRYRGSLNFGGATLTSVGGDDAFITKVTPVGVHAWSRSVGGSSSTSRDILGRLAFHPSGDLFAVGVFYGTVDVGNYLVSAGLSDGIIMRLKR